MTDFWNNPPEEPEVNCPKCGEPADYIRTLEDGCVYSCTACGHEFTAEYEQEPDVEAWAAQLEEEAALAATLK